MSVTAGHERGGKPTRSRSRPRLRTLLRGVALAAACAALLQVGYLIFAWALLPDQLVASARDAGVELEFTTLHSQHPGRIVLGGMALRGPHGWSLRAERLDATSRGYLPFGAPWQLDRCSVSGLFILHEQASLGPIHASVSAPSASLPGRLEAAGSEARVRFGEFSSKLAVALRAQVEHWRDIDEFRLGEGSLSLTTAQPRVHAVLQLETAVARDQSLGALGHVTVTGGDAGMWLDIARADDTVRWLLSELVGLPFELRAAVVVRDGWLRLEDVDFTAGPSRALGELRSDGEALHGALLVRRGQATLGLSLSDGGVRAQLMPPAHWLSQQLERLARDQHARR